MNTYRFTNGSLYKLDGNAYIHVARINPKIKTLKAAVKWYESLDEGY